MKLVPIAIDAPLRRLFDYEVPDSLAQPPRPGMRVRVPFGRGERIGIVAGGVADLPAPDFECRPLAAVLDAEPLIPAELFALCRWTADYYQHPLGEVLAAALPGKLRQGEAPRAATERRLRLTLAGHAALPRLGPRAAAQRRLLETLQAAPLARAELLASLPGSAAALRKAIAEGWIEACEAAAEIPALRLAQTPPDLSDEQQAALAQLRGGDGYRASLVEGVTGSGKTELYLQRAADVLAAGQQVLVLAPEIGLTPQLAERFAARFGAAAVASFHSGVSDGERARIWMAARDGRLPVVVGTRSAVFVPLARPGLILVDEEHDVSYKQQDGLRYSARDVAVLRARRLGIPVVLGSATPALESLHNARAGRYALVSLRQRVHNQPPPRVALLDVRHRPLSDGLSEVMIDAVDRHLRAGNQALLFLNRRGYAPVLLCHDCGHVTPCPNCDARLVLHRGRRRLVCHHCGHVVAMPTQCSDCGGETLVPVGQGTERIEDALRLRFPEARIERVDSDRLRSAAQMDRLFADVRAGAVNLLVGTQVLAKGHDFAGLTFAGLVDVDQALFGTDFRAIERMGQLVTQVAGRVGRAGQPGEVILQTHQPEHPLLKLLVERGYAALAEALLQERRDYGLPPFASLALLRAEAKREDTALAFLRMAKAVLPPARAGEAVVEVLGPAPATMARRAGYQRAQLLLSSASRAGLHQRLAAWMPELETLAAAKRVRWSLDIDPADLF